MTNKCVKFSSVVAGEVADSLACYDNYLKSPIQVSAGKVAGSVAAALAFLSPAHQKAIETIRDEIPGLASKFVYDLAVEAMRRCEMNADDAGECIQFVPIADMNKKIYDIRSADLEDLGSKSIEEWAGRVAGSTYLEEHFRIPRSTLYWWQRRQYVIALQKGGRKHVFPLAQFVDGRPVIGIRDVLSCIRNPRLAWFWLTRPSPDLNGQVPIEMLRRDLTQDVVLAVRALSSN